MEQIKVNAKEIMAKLTRLQTDMDYVREHIEDITLTEDDLSSLEEAEKEYKEGKTTSLEDLKKEISILRNSKLYRRLLEFEQNILKGEKYTRKDLGF